MAISYVVAEAFEHQIGSQLCAIPHAQVVQTLLFNHLLLSALLYTLKHSPEITEIGLKISADGWKLFRQQ